MPFWEIITGVTCSVSFWTCIYTLDWFEITHHSNKDVPCSIEWFSWSCTYTESQEPANNSNNELHDPDVIHDTDEGVEEHDDWKNLCLKAFGRLKEFNNL